MDQIEELNKYKSLYDSGAITEKEFAMLKQQLLGLKTDAEKEEEFNARRAEALDEIEQMKAAAQEEHIAAVKQAEEKYTAALDQAEEKYTAALNQTEEESMAALDKAEEKSMSAIEQAKEESMAAIKQAGEEHIETLKNAEAERLAAIEQEKLKGIEELKAQQEKYKQTYSEEKARQDAIAAAALEAQNKRQAARKETCRKAGHIIVLIISWIFVAFFLLFMIACFGLGWIGAGIACILLIFILCPPLSDLLKKIAWIEEHWWIKKIAVAVLVVLVFVLSFVASI